MLLAAGGKLLPSGPCGDRQQGHFFRERKEVMNVLDKIEAEQRKKDVTKFAVGDTVKVHTRVIEGDKERIQIYSGIVIGRKGEGINANFTVNKLFEINIF